MTGHDVHAGTRGEITAHQALRLHTLLAHVVGRNAFYTRKLASLDPGTLQFPRDLGSAPVDDEGRTGR